MATVYLAQDLKHDRAVAVKVLRPDVAEAVGAERFLAEIKTTAHLRHPHILPLFDSGSANGVLFYVMPFIDGESLRERLRRDGPLPIDEAVATLREIADALAPRALARHRASRREAGQRPDIRAARLPDGLRHRAGPRRSPGGRHGHRDGLHRGHAGVHGARADRRRTCRRAHGHLCVRRARLRIAHRRPAVHWFGPGRRHRASHETAGARDGPSSGRAASPRRSGDALS